MADTRRNSLLHKLETQLTPYIDEYKSHQESVKNYPAPVKAFFDAIHYISEQHGEDGYIQRNKLITAAKESNNFDSLLSVMKNFYYDKNSGSKTKNMIIYACLLEFNITQEMVDTVAKTMPMESNEHGSEKYYSPGPQRKARHSIGILILNGDTDAIQEIQLKSIFKEKNESEMQLKY